VLGAFRGSGVSVGIALAAGGALLLHKQTVRYPGAFQPVDQLTSLLDRTEAGPMAGIPVSVTGQVIGRGTPGYVLSPDLVVADESGFVPLVYRQPLPLVGLLFGLFRAGDFVGDRVIARGWYRRVPGPVIELRDVHREHGRGARTWWWAACYAVSVAVIYAGFAVVLLSVGG
jgi:hypothetical protein